MFSIEYRGIEGQAGLTARVQRKADGKWWDEVAEAWIATATVSCDLSLAEDVDKTGVYRATASFAPREGAIYTICAYGGAELATAEHTYRPAQFSALQMVREIQISLRLPLSITISEAHAQLILSFLNKALSLMMEQTSWPELKCRGSITLQAGVATYALYPMNSTGIDVVREMQIGVSPPIVRMTDENFRAYKRMNTEQGEPQAYRIYARAGGAVIVEVSPVPDQGYKMGYEALQRVRRLTTQDDVPLLNAETVIMGASAMARSEQGQDSKDDMDAFVAKLSLQECTHGEENVGDAEPV